MTLGKMAALMKSGRALEKLIKLSAFRYCKPYSTSDSGPTPNSVTESVNGAENMENKNEPSSDLKGLKMLGDWQNQIDEKIKLESSPPEEKDKKTFAAMFRKSKFVQIGDFRKTVVVGRIIEELNNDIYIEFGGKFYCVCKKPNITNPVMARNFSRGAKVKILLHDFEMTAGFFGTTKDVTLLEADATLLGLATKERNTGTDAFESFEKRRQEHTDWEKRNAPEVNIHDLINEIQSIDEL